MSCVLAASVDLELEGDTPCTSMHMFTVFPPQDKRKKGGSSGAQNLKFNWGGRGAGACVYIHATFSV